jgi:hypothetical protein
VSGDETRFRLQDGIDEDNGNHGGGPGCNQIDLLCWTFQDTGKATCELCLVGVPASATFSSTWAVATFRNDPCRAKSLLGKMQLTWSDATTSSATLGGRFIDGRPILSFSGTIDPYGCRKFGFACKPAHSRMAIRVWHPTPFARPSRTMARARLSPTAAAATRAGAAVAG